MHTQNCNSRIQNIHSIFCRMICNSSAATLIYFSKFSHLIFYTGIIHQITHFSNKLRICIRCTRFATTSSILLERNTTTKNAGIFLIIQRSIHRVIRRIYIRRKHETVGKSSSQSQFTVYFFRACNNFSHHIFKQF